MLTPQTKSKDFLSIPQVYPDETDIQEFLKLSKDNVRTLILESLDIRFRAAEQIRKIIADARHDRKWYAKQISAAQADKIKGTERLGRLATLLGIPSKYS